MYQAKDAFNSLLQFDIFIASWSKNVFKAN